MKIKTSTLLIILSTQICDASTSNASITNVSKKFNGFYVGVIAGAVRPTIETNFVIDNVGYSSKGAKNAFGGFLYGGMIGYGHNLNSFYLGAEIGVQSDTTNKKKKYEFTGPGGTGSFQLKYQRGPVLSIAPRFGIICDSSYIIYIKPALEISKDKLVAEDGESTKKKLRCVFVPTIGLEQAFSNNTFCKVEYSYNLGSKITEKFSEDGISGSVSAEYASHAVKFGLGYRF